MIRHKISQKYLWLLLLILWMGIIFFLSTDNFSAAKTYGILAWFLSWIGYTPSPASLEAFHWALRKGAHLTGYLVLFLLMTNTLDCWRAGKSKNPYWGLVFTVFYALTDEYHQSFTASRSMAAGDVVWDFLGAFLGFLLYLYVSKRREKPSH